MARHYWTAICNRAILDKDSNNVSLIDIVEQINFTLGSDGKVPADGFNVSMDLVSLWGRSNDSVGEKSKAQTTLIDPENRPVAKIGYELVLTEHPRTRSIARMIIGFKKGGKHIFKTEIEENGKFTTVSEIPVSVFVEPLSG